MQNKTIDLFTFLKPELQVQKILKLVWQFFMRNVRNSNQQYKGDACNNKMKLLANMLQHYGFVFCLWVATRGLFWSFIRFVLFAGFLTHQYYGPSGAKF